MTTLTDVLVSLDDDLLGHLQLTFEQMRVILRLAESLTPILSCQSHRAEGNGRTPKLRTQLAEFNASSLAGFSKAQNFIFEL